MRRPEVVLVCVPAAVRERDEADAGFDERVASRQLWPNASARTARRTWRLLAHVERVAGSVGRDDGVGLFAESGPGPRAAAVLGFDPANVLSRSCSRFCAVSPLLATVKPFQSDAAHAERTTGLRRRRGIERSVLDSEETRRWLLLGIATNGGRSRGPPVPWSRPLRSSGIRAKECGRLPMLTYSCPARGRRAYDVTPRRIANLSAQVASLGRCSQISTPSAFVLIGLNVAAVFGRRVRASSRTYPCGTALRPDRRRSRLGPGRPSLRPPPPSAGSGQAHPAPPSGADLEKVASSNSVTRAIAHRYEPQLRSTYPVRLPCHLARPPLRSR